MSDIQKFDMAAVQQRVSDSIKAQFAMLIPDEAFDQMAGAAITEFFHTEKAFEFEEIKRPNPNGSYYGDVHLKYVLTHAITPFQAMLWEEVRKIVEVKIRDWLESEKKKVEAKIETLYKGSEVAHTVFELNVNDLAMKMARDAHAEIIRQAAQNVQMNLMPTLGSMQCRLQAIDGKAS